MNGKPKSSLSNCNLSINSYSISFSPQCLHLNSSNLKFFQLLIWSNLLTFHNFLTHQDLTYRLRHTAMHPCQTLVVDIASHTKINLCYASTLLTSICARSIL